MNIFILIDKWNFNENQSLLFHFIEEIVKILLLDILAAEFFHIKPREFIPFFLLLLLSNQFWKRRLWIGNYQIYCVVFLLDMHHTVKISWKLRNISVMFVWCGGSTFKDGWLHRSHLLMIFRHYKILVHWITESGCQIRFFFTPYSAREFITVCRHM